MRRTTACIALVAALAVGSVSSRAWAQDNKVAAEALFDAGRKLVADGKYAEACAKFEQSQRLDPGIGTLLYLADCYERAGRYASAWATFRDGASQAHEAGQHERANAGEARAAALEPRLSKLTIKVSPEAQAVEGLSITRGSVTVAKALWGVAVPVDGGDYEVRASAPGMKPWTTKISLPDEKGTASVEVPALAVDPDAQKPAEPPKVEPPPPVVEPTPHPVTPPPPPPPPDSTQRTLGVVFGGVGLVGLGFGTYFGLRAISKNSDAKGFCDGAVCHDQQGVDLTDQAKSAATISNIAFGAGLTSLAAGVILYATAPTEERPPTSSRRVHVDPMLAPGFASLSVGGLF